MGKSKVFCSAFGCNSLARRNPELSFHFFPKPGRSKATVVNKMGVEELIDCRKAWELKLKMGKPVTPFMRICSRHFKPQDFMRSAKGKGIKKRLKKDAVPTENLPERRFTRKIQPRKIVTKQKQQSPEIMSFLPELNEVEECCNTVVDNNGYSAEELLVADSLCLLSYQKTYSEVAVQVNTQTFTTICDNIDSDNKLNSLTGLHSFDLFNVIEDLVKQIHKDIRVHRLNLRERIMLTFVKLKSGLSYVILAVLFGNISSQTCKTIFFEMITILSLVLKPFIAIPTKEEILCNQPKCFKDFKNVVLVLDCTEIPIQKSKCLCCRIKCYSHYKGTTTIKFMTAVTPAGLIAFVSRAYGGRVSDTEIFKQSNVVKYLSHQDAVMVDKGFLIQQECATVGVQVIQPPFLKNKTQLSKEESADNVKIARARIHIERSNQRLKIFNILNNNLPWSLVPKIEEIFTVICAVVNLSQPILSTERF